MRTPFALAMGFALASVLHAVPALASAHGDATLELDGRLARVRAALATGDVPGAIDAFRAVAAFYRTGGDRRSAAAADLEAAYLLSQLGSWDDAFATLAPSDADEVESPRLARRQHIRVVVLERRGETAAARDAIVAVRRAVTREDWHRHLAGDAKRLGVAYGWPALERRTLAPILLVEWGALIALVVVLYRRGGRGAAAPGGADGRV